MRRRRKREGEPESVGDAVPAPQPESRLTPMDVQQKVFRLAFRGYNERDVDEFLDQVTESLAALHEENKRLSEAAQDAGPGSAASTAGADRQAAEIVREAREHAARLLEESERRAAEVGPGSGTVESTPSVAFLARERQFLQQLAGLIQDHARFLKEEARRGRENADAPGGAAPEGESTGRLAGPAAEPPEPPRPPEPQDVGPAGRPPDTSAPRPAPGPPRAPEAGPTEESGTGATVHHAGPVAGPVAEPAVAGRQEGPPEEAPEPSPTVTAPVLPPAPATPPAASPPAPPASPPAADEQRAEETAAEPWRPPEPAARGPGPVPQREEQADPLLSAWESAFLARPEEEPRQAPAPAREDDREAAKRSREEPSLRELFWGEE